MKTQVSMSPLKPTMSQYLNNNSEVKEISNNEFKKQLQE
jgi:hypothetical protein